jgi:protein-disulfide isomerase
MKITRRFQRILTWSGVVLLFVLVGLGMIKLSANTQLPVVSGSLAAHVSARDNIEGPTNAAITLVEYSDFQCPACALFGPILDKLLSEPLLSGKVRVVYRYFPLSGIHANAQLSARSAQAAALQGKFWQMHDLLFKNQTDWAGTSASNAMATFIGYAQQLELDVNKFTTDLDSSAVSARVQADYDSGVHSGVDSTPSFFVNGTRMPHPASYDAFKQYLVSKLSN